MNIACIRKYCGLRTYGHAMPAVNAGIVDGSLVYVNGVGRTIMYTFQTLDAIVQIYGWHRMTLWATKVVFYAQLPFSTKTVTLGHELVPSR